MIDNNIFLNQSGVKFPVICGPMYPCSNPELVAAASESGALGIVQPIALTYVHGYEFEAGLKYIQSLTSKPVGMNLLIEKNSKKYHQRMEYWLETALENGIKFFITSLGKPDWVVEKAHAAGAYVYHDVTEAKWAHKAVDVGVDGLIAVNNRAGGHAGAYAFNELFEQLSDFNLPIVCAGGIADKQAYQQVLQTGYQAVQMGTRFIATTECNASDAYKKAIVDANEQDIVLSERITGIPVSVINTALIQKMGLKPNSLERWMLAHAKLKYFMRTILALKSFRSLKLSLKDESGNNDYWQAGKSVASIKSELSVQQVMDELTAE